MNTTDPRSVEIAEYCIDKTLTSVKPYTYEILSIKEQTVAGRNYDLIVKTFFRSTVSMLSLLFSRYNLVEMFNNFFFDSSSYCYSKDRFIVYDRFGNLTIKNHTAIQRTCQF